MADLRLRFDARLVDAVGGHARLRVLAILAGVLALDSADKSSVGAVAPALERSLGLDNVQVGLLVSVTTAVSALATLPLGALVDRVHRVHLLTVVIVVWSLAAVASGLAQSFLALLLIRGVLGVAAAAAGPAVGSLIGDLFPHAERTRIYGFVLAGELVGAGLGFLLAGDLATALSWRSAFWCLGVAGVGLAVVLRRFLPEPERGGASRLAPMPGTAAARAHDAAREALAGRDTVAPDAGRYGAPVADVEPYRPLVLDRDPSERSLFWAIRYVLAVPTNRMLIAASALGYFFLAGLRTYAVLFFGGRFHLSDGAASTLVVVLGSGSVLGVLLSGRIADRAIARGRVAARPAVAGVSFLAAAALFLPALLVPGLLVAAPLFFLGATGLGAANPPIDAARLDVVHSRLWGRGEAVEAVCRFALESLAPLAFGLVSVLFGAHSTHPKDPGTWAGLESTFLVMLVAVLAAGLLTAVGARRTYPRDVATSLASQRRTDAAEAAEADDAAGRS